MARSSAFSVSTALLLLLCVLTLANALNLDMEKRAAGKKVECEMDGEAVVCDGVKYAVAEEDDFPTPRFWIDLAVSASLVCLAGLMSGLTMGLMSIDFLNLQ